MLILQDYVHIHDCGGFREGFPGWTEECGWDLISRSLSYMAKASRGTKTPSVRILRDTPSRVYGGHFPNTPPVYLDP
jgi:hypothetical protein